MQNVFLYECYIAVINLRILLNWKRLSIHPIRFESPRDIEIGIEDV